MFESGAQYRDVECQYEIGRYLVKGYGVPAGDKKRIKTLKCTSSSSSVGPLYELGQLFRFGWRTTRDYVQAAA